MSLVALTIFISLTFAIALLTIFVSYLLGRSGDDRDSNYQCGVKSDNIRENRFNINLIKQALPFLVYLLTITVLIPWSLYLTKHRNEKGIWTEIGLFLFVILIGYVYLRVSKTVGSDE
jgi:NADH:ubiquinone oxidoreductase subunit 3 (subunit A)